MNWPISVTVFLFFLGLFLAACAPKTPDGVFPLSSLDSVQGGACVSNAQVLPNRFIISWESGETTVEQGPDAENFKTNFIASHLDEIKHVEFDQVIHAPALNSLSSSTSLADPSDVHWGQAIIEAQAAWDQGFLGAGIRIGVVDSAVDFSQAQLTEQIAKNEPERTGLSGRDDDGNGYIDDVNGWDFYRHKAESGPIPAKNDHGTHVSGIIVADHAKGDAWGIAPQAKIIAAPFMDDDGHGLLSDAVPALRYVASRGVQIINASWGASVCSQLLKDEVSHLNDQGILFVVAAGNSGVNLDNVPQYPAAFFFPNQITVAASMSTDRLASYSNTSYKYVQIAAPGDGIFSTTPAGGAYMSGTSMAAPFFSGAAAVVWSVRPQATYLEVRDALFNSVDLRSFRVSTGGRLNLRKAVAEIQRSIP